MPSYIKNLTFDCVDALRVARFWAAALSSDVDEDSTADRASRARDDQVRVSSVVTMCGLAGRWAPGRLGGVDPDPRIMARVEWDCRVAWPDGGHGMRMEIDPADERAFGKLSRRLEDGFGRWAAARSLAVDPFVVELMLDYKGRYLDGHLGCWCGADLEDMLCEWFPRKATADEETIGRTVPTVAAFIGAGGLGQPIFNALQGGFKTQFVASGVLAVLLALVADGLLVILQRLLTPWTRGRSRAA